jgi:hypothetical protein
VGSVGRGKPLQKEVGENLVAWALRRTHKLAFIRPRWQRPSRNRIPICLSICDFCVPLFCVFYMCFESVGLTMCRFLFGIRPSRNHQCPNIRPTGRCSGCNYPRARPLLPSLTHFEEPQVKHVVELCLGLYIDRRGKVVEFWDIIYIGRHGKIVLGYYRENRLRIGHGQGKYGRHELGS